MSSSLSWDENLPSDRKKKLLARLLRWPFSFYSTSTIDYLKWIAQGQLICLDWPMKTLLLIKSLFSFDCWEDGTSTLFLLPSLHIRLQRECNRTRESVEFGRRIMPSGKPLFRGWQRNANPLDFISSLGFHILSNDLQLKEHWLHQSKLGIWSFFLRKGERLLIDSMQLKMEKIVIKKSRLLGIIMWK